MRLIDRIFRNKAQRTRYNSKRALWLFPVLLILTLATSEASKPVVAVPATETLIARASSYSERLATLLKIAKPTLGVPYVWGGTRLTKGIDCSNYTWQLYRQLGDGYERFQGTQRLALLRNSDGLRRIDFENAKPGDLLVYGYKDAQKGWQGHVVILIDKDGSLTGRKGLVLGAHGGDIDAVQFVTYRGFDDGYFKEPVMKLSNVLRLGN